MRTKVFDTPEAAARGAAEQIERWLAAAVSDRGRASVAFSGGRSPTPMFDALAKAELSWRQIDVFQADERVAAADSPTRNLTGLNAHLIGPAGIPQDNLHAMPVELAGPDAAADTYAATLTAILGDPPVLDVLHLGMGADGHTASLIPGDPSLTVDDRLVVLTGLYQGTRRLSLAFDVLNRARHVVFLVTGADKQAAVARLLARDTSIPAGRVRQEHAFLCLDRAALPE
ncbi:MAG: 6-phosphogluconolactonase [Deltaproteobacteria bacterium]|nr:6-phosphogluconolactonase [Deltaproteobacteria bacterium]